MLRSHLSRADGVVGSHRNMTCEQPPRPRLSKERDHLLDGAATLLQKEGNKGSPSIQAHLQFRLTFNSGSPSTQARLQLIRTFIDRTTVLLTIFKPLD